MIDYRIETACGETLEAAANNLTYYVSIYTKKGWEPVGGAVIEKATEYQAHPENTYRAYQTLTRTLRRPKLKYPRRYEPPKRCESI